MLFILKLEVKSVSFSLGAGTAKVGSRQAVLQLVETQLLHLQYLQHCLVAGGSKARLAFDFLKFGNARSHCGRTLHYCLLLLKRNVLSYFWLWAH